jgi:hypothetical protein
VRFRQLKLNPSIDSFVYTETKPGRRSILSRTLFVIIPVASYLFLLSYVPLPAALASGNLISVVLSRLSIVGIVVLGILSGFGAVSNAWVYFPFSSSKQHLQTDMDISASERSLLRIRDDLLQRRLELQKREAAKVRLRSSHRISGFSETP